MFQHPSLRKNTRHTFGHFGNGWNVIKLANPITLSGNVELAFADWLRRKAVEVPNNTIPAGSVFVVYNGLGQFTDPVVYWMNGKSVRFELDPDAPSAGGVGSREFARRLEGVLSQNPFANTTFHADYRGAQAAAEALWSGNNYSTDTEEEHRADGAEPETSDASEPETSDASTSAPATPTTPSYTPKTGYYKDNAGYAWYYNAAQDYMEAIAAPKGKYTTQPRFSKSSGSKYGLMKGILTAANATDRASAIAHAAKSGGEALPASRSSAPPAASPVPTEVANRGAAQTSKKKGIPGWVWWTSGTVLVAGLGVWGAIMIKKNKAAAQ
jgi:hypothetical protein